MNRNRIRKLARIGLGIVATSVMMTACLVDSGTATLDNSHVTARRYWEKSFVGTTVSGGKTYDCYSLVTTMDFSSKADRSLTSAWVAAQPTTPGAITCQPPQYPPPAKSTCTTQTFSPSFKGVSIGSYNFKTCSSENIAIEFPWSGPGARLKWDPTGYVGSGRSRRLVFAVFAGVPKGAAPPNWKVTTFSGFHDAVCGTFGCSTGDTHYF